MKFQEFNPPCDEIDVALFINLQIPKYRTVDVVGIRELDVDSINFKNSNGQIINLARSTGTDKDNVSQLQESLVNEGWDLTKIPPIVEEKSLNLFDGFSRHEALVNLQQQKAPYLVVERKEGFTVDDVIDEILVELSTISLFAVYDKIWPSEDCLGFSSHNISNWALNYWNFLRRFFVLTILFV